MRICRFNDSRVGVVEGGELADVTAVIDDLPALKWPATPGDLFIAKLPDIKGRIEALAQAAPRLPLAEVRLLSPVANPSKIIAAPANYEKHRQEAAADPGINFGRTSTPIDKNGLFIKSSTSLVGPSDGVTMLKHDDRRMDHEVELTVVIGKEGRYVSRADAMGMVAGYAIGLDMSVRGTEDRSLRKSFDSASVLGPYLVTADEIADPGHLDLSLSVNGEARQASNTDQLIFDIPRLIEYASAFYRLYPGDLIMTGTPEGVGPVVPGDVMICKIAEIGEMTVPVRAG